MAITKEPCVWDLKSRGFVRGYDIKAQSSDALICHYFGGIPYALPPTGPFRWRRPRPLDPSYSYGTRVNPGDFTGEASVSHQLGNLSGKGDEDCLQCNIWVPAGAPPQGGWPVYFYIHGGFLQVGTANGFNPIELFYSTTCKFIIVRPAYRLSLFGFLASRELRDDTSNTDKSFGNFGFWDLRLALEWTYDIISHFRGNPSNLTVGGYSAGAHAAFHQLAFDLGKSRPKRLIRRLIMHSNGPGVQPKSLAESQAQFDELVDKLDVQLGPGDADLVSRLRALPPATLLAAARGMQRHQFRAATDGAFVRASLFAEIADGTFARRMVEGNVQLLLGECKDEHFAYATWRPPANSLDAVFERLTADYPRTVCEALLRYYFPDGELPRGWPDWRFAFGKVYADMQVHAGQRGFVNALDRGGAGGLIWRYRVEKRLRCADVGFPKEWGVTHGTDELIWYFGNGLPLTEEEKYMVQNAFLNDLGVYIRGGQMSWRKGQLTTVRSLQSNGKVDTWTDELWDRGLQVWDASQGSTDNKESKAKL